MYGWSLMQQDSMCRCMYAVSHHCWNGVLWAESSCVETSENCLELGSDCMVDDQIAPIQIHPRPIKFEWWCGNLHYRDWRGKNLAMQFSLMLVCIALINFFNVSQYLLFHHVQGNLSEAHLSVCRNCHHYLSWQYLWTFP